MPDYSGIDWDQPMPTSAEMRLAWAHSTVRPLPLDPRIQTVVDLFREERTSARMAAAQFALDLDDAYRWFLQRNRLAESPFFHDLFRSLDILEAVPNVGELFWTPATLADSHEGRTIGQGQGMKLVNGWEALSTLASWISVGGLHIDHDQKPADREVLALTRGVAAAAFTGEMSQGSSYRSFATWADWFEAEGFDCSLAFFDHGASRATIVMLTDSP